MRCYRDQPVDCPLLVTLAFEEVVGPGTPRKLSRAQLTPANSKRILEANKAGNSLGGEEQRYACEKFINETCPELRGLPDERYALGRPSGGGAYSDYYKVLQGLGPRYIPEHQAMLLAVHKLMVPD